MHTGKILNLEEVDIFLFLRYFIVFTFTGQYITNLPNKIQEMCLIFSVTIIIASSELTLLFYTHDRIRTSLNNVFAHIPRQDKTLFR